MTTHAHGGSQAGLSLVAILAISVLALSLDLIGVYPPRLVSSGIIVACGALIAMRHSFLSFRTVSFMIIFYPALAPAYAWDLMGAELFSWAAQYLQFDRDLVGKQIFLFAVGAATFTAMAAPASDTGTRQSMQRHEGEVRVATLDGGVLWVVALVVVISAYIIDSGPTILTSAYTEVLEGRLEASTLVVVMVSIFGGAWSALFVFGRHKRTILWTATFIAVAWLFLHARRVEVFGIALVMVLWLRYFFDRRQIMFAAGAFVFVQVAVEFVRIFGVLQYITGGIDAYSLEVLSGFGMQAALPGGASNVFLSGLHLIDLKDRGVIDGWQALTMLEWPRALVPNTIWTALGAPPVLSEHETIFNDLELSYVGGMPLLSVFYLNGGVALVLVFGALHGAIANRVEDIVHAAFSKSLYIGGSATFFVTLVFVVYQFRYHWYNPQTMIRALVFSFIIMLMLTAFLRMRSIIQQGRAETRADRPRQGEPDRAM